MKQRPDILIAGIGNIFLGDDAFGVEVVAQLSNMQLPEHVQVVDFGIRGLDLAYTLLDGYQTVILVDAVPRGSSPGSVYVIEPDRATVEPNGAAGGVPMEAHRMDPQRVLQLVATLGGTVGRLLVVGCEPTPCREDEEFHDGLSDAVQAAVPVAVSEILRLIEEQPVAVETASCEASAVHARGEKT